MSRTLADTYRRFGEVDVAESSPLSASVALALGRSEEALQTIEQAPPSKRRPALVLAALHDLALSGRAPDLAAAYAAGDPVTAGQAAVDTLLRHDAEVLAIAVRRRLRPETIGHAPVLCPAVAEAAHRAGADTIGLIDLACGASLDLVFDRVGVRYDNGQTLGDPQSSTQLTASVVGRTTLPTRPVPPVAIRIGIDADPVDPTDTDDVRWLRACQWPERTEQSVQLDGQLALAAAEPIEPLRGDPVARLPEALERVPSDVLPVVLTTWALSQDSLEDRLHFLQHLTDAATHRAVAWVSVEGVGVAPAVPTFGDRRASGHSIIGVTVVEQSTLRTEAVGRCWSRGRLLAWLTLS